MQQAIVADERGADPTPGPQANAFVINLISSTTPVALTRPDHAGLNRFTFFVSRRREDGRERFRLHMGYFDTQEEAEKLLDIVRTIYPGAWAGLTPGRRLSAAARATGSAPATPAAPDPAPAPAAVRSPAPAAAVTRPIAAPIPVLVPVPAPASAPAAASAVAMVPAVAIAPAVAVVPVLAAAPTPTPTPVPLRVVETPRSPDALAPAAVPAADSDRRAAARSLSDIRNTIASLGDSVTIPVLQPAPELSDSATLRVLESGVAPTAAASSAVAAEGTIGRPAVSERPATSRRPVATHGPATSGRVATPGQAAISARPAVPARGVPATAGARAAAEQPREDKPCYAVQLMWSVQPIAMAQVPQLAIFSAYTLYGAEGNRDGRRWYGLRLGFFTDAVSAKQVAHYVRADFSTVSVVPVTVREREQARLASARVSGPGGKSTAAAAGKAGEGSARAAAGGAAVLPGKSEFAFIDDKEPVTIKTAKPGGAVQLRPGVPVRATRGAPGKRAKQRPPGQVHARTRARPMTMEETLEILGAGALQVDEGRDTAGHDPGTSRPGADGKAKASRLSRLIERLSDRLVS
jgi:hypothetical protein